MTIALILLLATGLCWVGVASTVSHAAEKNLDLGHIQFASALLIALVAGCLCIFQANTNWLSPETWLIAFPVILAGSMNFIMLSWMKKGMRIGHAGAVWGITQSSMLCPFVMGVLFFNVQPTATRLIGIALILIGIALFSRTKPAGNNASGYRWLLPTLGAFAASGAAQCMANLPSYFQAVPLSSTARCFVIQLGTAGAFGVYRGITGKRAVTQRTLKPILLLSAMQVLSLCFFFYNGLNLAAAAGAGSIGYPVAQGSCIFFFMLYETLFLHRKTPLSAWFAALLLCSGIILVAL